MYPTPHPPPLAHTHRPYPTLQATRGVQVFAKESFAGDWLETVGLWQQGADLSPYTPHPDFWVAALWNKLMGPVVLAARTSPSDGLKADASALLTVSGTNSPRSESIGHASADPQIRVFAHCSRLTRGAVTLAVASLFPRGPLSVTVPGVQRQVQWMLSSSDPAADSVLLNDAPATLETWADIRGRALGGDEVVVDAKGVGFVELHFAEPVPACVRL